MIADINDESLIVEYLCPQCFGRIDEPERCALVQGKLFCCLECADDYYGEGDD